MPYNKDAKVGKFWKFCFSFFNPKSYKEFPGAIQSLKQLHDEGTQVVLLTSRPLMAPFVASLQEWLNDHDVMYDKLVMGCSNKPVYVAQNNADVLIDDCQSTCKEVEDVGVKSIRFKGSIKSRVKKFKMPKASNIANTWKMVLEKVQKIFEEDFIPLDSNFASIEERV